MNDIRTFKNFNEYWDWGRNVDCSERIAAVRVLPNKEKQKLQRQYKKYEKDFTTAQDIEDLDDWYEWSEGKSTEQRLAVIWAMDLGKKRGLIRECSQRRGKRKEMKTNKYEFRFQNGDVFFSDKQDMQLLATATLQIDHEKRTIVKNRYGQTGHQAYNQMFPKVIDQLCEQKNKLKDINDLEAIKAELDHWTPMETHLPITTRITNIVQNYQSLASLYTNLQKAYRELEAKCSQ